MEIHFEYLHVKLIRTQLNTFKIYITIVLSFPYFSDEIEMGRSIQHFVTKGSTEVSRRRVKNYILWQRAMGPFDSSGSEETKQCLTRYNLPRVYSGIIQSMIKNTHVVGYHFQVMKRGRSPVRDFQREQYHDDSPDRKSMENMGVDLSKRIGKRN